MVNKEVAQFIRACAYFQLVNLFSHEAQQSLQTIDSDTPFYVVFLDFWEPGDIPDQDGYRNILSCLDFITAFGLEADTGMKEVTSEQAARWDFGDLFVPFGIPKMIVVDADGLFPGMFNNTFQDTLLIPVHAVARGNHKEIINEGFHRYLKKVQKINSVDKGSLHQWLQCVLFSMYDWNSCTADGTDIAQSVVAIVREFPFIIDISPERLREITSEGQQALDHFEAAYPILFIQRDFF